MPSRISTTVVFSMAIALWAIGIIGLSTYVSQSEFFPILAFSALSFVGYFTMVYYPVKIHIMMGVVLGLLLRLFICSQEPLLSDDIFRFYWDGLLIHEGVNPYGILPAEALKNNLSSYKYIYDQLNSQQYYTIYPPVAQAIFYIGAAAKNLESATLIMRLIFMAIEGLGLYFMIRLLRDLHLDIRWAWLYYLNPMVIIEGIGNLHIESVMISILVVAIYMLRQQKIGQAVSLLVLSIGVKILPLMLLPFIVINKHIGSKIKYGVVFTLLLGFLFLPLFFGSASNGFLDSVDLYFRKFEFNASIYFLIAHIGKLITGYNVIQILGPILALMTIGVNLYYAYKSKDKSIDRIFHYGLIVWSVYLFLATTVHPWYIIPILFWGIMTQKRWPLLWSFLGFMSYSFYDTVLPDAIKNFILTFTYILLFFCIYFEKKKTYDFQ
jgi:alpha-1,6-mannosyltransferase